MEKLAAYPIHTFRFLKTRDRYSNRYVGRGWTVFTALKRETGHLA